jgi:hypothetical protein
MWDRSQMIDHKAETDWLNGGWDTGSVELVVQSRFKAIRSAE